MLLKHGRNESLIAAKGFRSLAKDADAGAHK